MGREVDYSAKFGEAKMTGIDVEYDMYFQEMRCTLLA